MLYLSLLALTLRGIPELLSGPYPVGYDLLAGYLPAIGSFPDITSMNLFGWSWSPLAILILWSFRQITNAPELLLLKAAGPAFFAIFVCSLYYALVTGLQWNKVKATISMLIVMSEPAILRLGWDQLRLELGLSFFFLLLAITKGNLTLGATRKWKEVLALGVLVVVSDQISAVVMAIAFMAQLCLATYRQRLIDLKPVLPFVPPGILFTVGSYMTYFAGHYGAHLAPLKVQVMPGIAFQNYLSGAFPFGSSYLTVLFTVGSLSLLCVFPILPLAAKGRFKDNFLLPLTVWFFVASYSIVLSPSLSLAYFWWWMFLLPIPLTLYAVNGLDKFGYLKGKRLRVTAIGIALLSIFAIAYSTSAIAFGNTYTFPYLPSGLVQSCVEFGDISSIGQVMSWANGTLPQSAIVVVPEQFQGFASNLRNDIMVRVASPSSTLSDYSGYFPANVQVFAIGYPGFPGTIRAVTLVQYGSVSLWEFFT